MNIVYDGSIYRSQVAGGINRYFAEIIGRLPADWTPQLIGAIGLGLQPPRHPRLAVASGPIFRPRRISMRLRRWRWDREYFREADLLHPTYYDLADDFPLSAVRCPVVVTVHDLIHATHPHLFGDSGTVVPAQREFVDRADHIICVSHATERDLLDRIPRAAGKTTVIHHGASFLPSAVVAPAREEGARWFLYVGSRHAYKNFPFLLAAFAKARGALPGIRLRLAGAPFTIDDTRRIAALGLSDAIELHVYPDEEKLRELYAGSLALLYPSLHEGFGFPPLEAMAGGTVAVTANTTSLPEIVGDGGIMLDPHNQSDWVECILQLARSKTPRAEIIRRGYAQVARFSWDRSSAMHLEIYERLRGAGARRSSRSSGGAVALTGAQPAA